MATENDRSIQEIINSQISILPENVRKAVVDGDWRKTVYKIGQKYNLHIDKIGELENEIFLVMIGLESSADIIPNILKNVDPRRDLVNSIVSDVNNEIFVPIREYLRKTESQLDQMDQKINSSAPKNEEVRETPQKTVEIQPQPPVASKVADPMPAPAPAPITAPVPAPKPTPEPVAELATGAREMPDIEIGEIPSRADLLKEIEEVGTDGTESEPLIKLDDMKSRLKEASVTKPVESSPQQPVAQKQAPEKPNNTNQANSPQDPYREPIN